MACTVAPLAAEAGPHQGLAGNAAIRARTLDFEALHAIDWRRFRLGYGVER